MNQDTVRLNITLKKDLALELEKMTGPRKRSHFISKAIETSILKEKKETLEKLLEEGYRSTKQESLDLAQEFEDIDLEAWDEY